MKSFGLALVLSSLFCAASLWAAPLGVPSPFPKPPEAQDTIPTKLLLEKLPQGGDALKQTHFFGNPIDGQVWEIGPDHKVYSVMKLKPWKPKPSIKLKTIESWLREIPRLTPPSKEGS